MPRAGRWGGWVGEGPPAQNPLRGIVLKLMSVTVFMAMYALIKATADAAPPGQQVFFRSFFAIPVIFAWLALRGEAMRSLRTHRPMGHVYRGVAGTAAMGFGFAGAGMLPLPEFTALNFAAPLLTVIFAALILGERVRAFRMTVVALGFAGVVIVLSPAFDAGAAGPGAREVLGAAATLTGAVFGGLAQIFARRLALQESASVIVFWFSVTSSMLALLTLPFGWTLPGPGTAALLVASGLLGGAGQILLTLAYRSADASLVAPFDYSAMLFAILIGFFVFDEVPARATLIGASVVIAAGVLIIWRERQLGLERARQRQAAIPGRVGRGSDAAGAGQSSKPKVT